MGWSFEVQERSRKDFVDSIRSQAHFGPGYTYLDGRAVGNHIWGLVRDESAGRKFITLDLIAKERNGGWGYKGMSEDMGPYHYDCPLSLIERATDPTNDSAREWRQKVIAYHAARAKAGKAEVGRLVWSCGTVYRLLGPLGPRKGWRVLDVNSGVTYRMPAGQLSRALK